MSSPVEGGAGEEQAAQEAASKLAEGDAEDEATAATLFDKLVSGEIPADVIFQDDRCMAFRDISPQAPVHFLVIPKQKDGLSRLSRAREDQKELLGHLMFVAQSVAREQGLADDGFRVVINDGPNGCQSVYHLHLHVIGGRQLKWPPG